MSEVNDPCGYIDHRKVMCDCVESELAKVKELIEEFLEYSGHTRDCVRSNWEAGEPTGNGGYRTKYNGKWYQAKPVDETPKCDCGFAEVLLKKEKSCQI